MKKNATKKGKEPETTGTVKFREMLSNMIAPVLPLKKRNKKKKEDG